MVLIRGALSKDRHFLVVKTLQLIVKLLILVRTGILQLIIDGRLIEIETPRRLTLLFLLKFYFKRGGCWAIYFAHSHAILVGNANLISVISPLLLLISH